MTVLLDVNVLIVLLDPGQEVGEKALANADRKRPSVRHAHLHGAESDRSAG
ncbi:hypothetical protein [Acidithiobacillus sulfuriphilus]|uniref:Uncharacterized protein n=1 Tax=Acidithiobacillus sulfuriphilus TaxID=1867749 RepID=A0ACD5HMA6_9PROT|nr:hypothetical protein [Acidithiobacillus sulfuriphilus]